MAQATVPADRYGIRSGGGSRHLGLIVTIVILVAAALGWAGWVAYDDAHTPVSWADGPFTPVDDGHARFTFMVTTAPGRTAVCTVRMFNDGLTEVGRVGVDVGPSPDRTFSVTAVVPTFEAASSGTVEACAVR